MQTDTRKQKHRQLMAIFRRLNIGDEQRHELVYTWTKGRTNSTRELTDGELNDLLWKFNNDIQSRRVADGIELEKRKKRSIVLAIAQRCGIHTGTDFYKFNSFMTSRSIHKKSLSKYSLEELDDLINQFRGLERNYDNSAAHAGTRAWYQKRGIPEVNKN